MMNRLNLEAVNKSARVYGEEEQIVFVKLLISDKAANRILSNSGSMLKKIKQVNHVFILVSGANKYFPGTNYRVATLEGSEKNVNETMEVLNFLLKSNDDERHEEGSRICYDYNVRIAVPRSVIGSIIGIRGEFITHVRTVTNAHINISPIFVTSDKACNERIITISGNNSNNVVHAFIILTKKVNSSPEGRSCKTIIYRRADIFKRRDQRVEKEKAEPPLNFRLDNMDNISNDNPANKTDRVDQKVSEKKQRPKLNFKSVLNGRWSEQVDLLAHEDNNILEESENEQKQIEIIQQGLVEGIQMNMSQQDGLSEENSVMQVSLGEKLYEAPPKAAHGRIPTSIFITSFLALVAGALFLQYISKEIIHV